VVIRQGFLSRWLVVAIIAALVLAPSAAAQPARGGVATVKVTNGTVAVGNPDVGGQPAEIEAGETSIPSGDDIASEIERFLRGES